MKAVVRRTVGGVIYETPFDFRNDVIFQEGETCYFGGTKYYIRKITSPAPPLIELEPYDRTEQD